MLQSVGGSVCTLRCLAYVVGKQLGNGHVLGATVHVELEAVGRWTITEPRFRKDVLESHRRARFESKRKLRLHAYPSPHARSKQHDVLEQEVAQRQARNGLLLIGSCANGVQLHAHRLTAGCVEDR